MKIILHRSFGTVEIDTADDKEAIAQASFWSELPDECPKCAAGLFLHYRETKDDGYKYFEIHCRGTVRHRSQFGQHKSGGLFYKRDWQEATFGPPTAADRDEFDREQGRQDSEWKTRAPAPDPEEFAGDEQVQAAFKAIRDRMAEPWNKKPDEGRDQYLERLRRQYKSLVEMHNEIPKSCK